MTKWPHERFQVQVKSKQLACVGLYARDVSFKGTVTNQSSGQKPVTVVLILPPPQRLDLSTIPPTTLCKYTYANREIYC